MSCAFVLEHKQTSLPPPQLLENEAGTQGALPRDMLLSVISCHAIHLPTSSVDLWSSLWGHLLQLQSDGSQRLKSLPALLNRTIQEGALLF